MKLSICIGSSCHIKGSYQIIEEFRRCIKQYDVADRVELKANFCLGRCQHAVSVTIDDQPCHQLAADETQAFFETYVLGGLAP